MQPIDSAANLDWSTAAVDKAANGAAVSARSALQNTPDYPPISTIPSTTLSRLLRASPPGIPDYPVPAPTVPLVDANDASTVLYLAYGSNLAAATFLGVRGIRPVSQVNIHAPSLRLTFDLPGIPYNEPCFANTSLRKIPKVPKLPPELPGPPRLPSDRSGLASTGSPSPGCRTSSHGDPVWDGGLIGVVYEVTPEDYAKIIRTEGGGSAYQDILVPCVPLPPAVSIPERPPLPELPRPFLAHTLFVPPDIPADGGAGGDGPGARTMLGDGRDGEPPAAPRPPWWARFLGPRRRPDPERAQPSARYLNLIRDGAREHDLPADYQAWLASLASYTVSSPRQSVAQLLVQVTVMPLMLLVLALGRLLGDKEGDGAWPLWLRVVMGMLQAAVWWAYDNLLHPVFGDGERTEDVGRSEDGAAPTHQGPGSRRRAGRPWCFPVPSKLVPDEEKCLLRGAKR